MSVSKAIQSRAKCRTIEVHGLRKTHEMKRSAILGWLLLGVLIQSAGAGSAVAIGSNGRLGAAVGWPVKEAKRRALRMCVRNGGINPRIFVSSDWVGECAVAIGHNRSGKGSIIGVALGRRSATEAQARAVEECRKAGGVDPKIKLGLRG
jgi:hypothetical protein